MKGIRISTTAVLGILLVSFGLSLGPIESANAQYSGCPNTWNVKLPNLQVKSDGYGRSRFSYSGEVYSLTNPLISLSKYSPAVDKYIKSLKQNASGTLQIQISDQQEFKNAIIDTQRLMAYYYAGVVPFWGPTFGDDSTDMGSFVDVPPNPWLRLQLKVDVKNCPTFTFNSNSIQILGDTWVRSKITNIDSMYSKLQGKYMNALLGWPEEIDTSGAVELCQMQIASLGVKISDMKERIAKNLIVINDPQTNESMRSTYQASLASLNSALKTYEDQKLILEKYSKYFKEWPALIKITASSSFNSEANRVASKSQNTSPPKAAATVATQKPQVSLEGQSCTKPGQTKVEKQIKYACLIVGKKYRWTSLSGPGSTEPNKGATPSPSATSSTSEADKLVAAGCKAFPNAIIRLQNSSGGTYNSALIAAQEAASNINQASRLDGKYGILNNAQFIIIQYAQAVGWGGRGYTGDINTVRTALANFNSSCGSSLKL